MSGDAAFDERPLGSGGVAPALVCERERWLVVDKPAGWHTVEQRGGRPPDVLRGSEAGGHESRARSRTGADAPHHGVSSAEPTVEAWLRDMRPELASLPETGIVHRLDRSTSGCLLVAKSDAAQSELRAAISDRAGGIRKVYLAVLRRGVAPEGSFALYFHGRHRGSAKVSVRDHGDPRELGRCRWRRLTGMDAAPLARGGATEASPQPATSDLVILAKSVARFGDLVEVELIGPGRRHQIRAGFAHLGFPLRGDALYRGDAPIPGLDGAALHAWRLTIDGETVEAPLPPAWINSTR